MKMREQTAGLIGAQARIGEYSKLAADMGAEEVLYRVGRCVDDVFAPLVRDLAYQVHGHPGVAPEVLASRAAASHQRAVEASARADAFFESLRRAASVGPGFPPMLGWRASLAIALAAAVIGVCLPAPDWRACAILTLSAGLAVLVLPLVPSAIRSCLLGSRGLAICLRDLFMAAFASCECRRFEHRGRAAADHRARIDEWVGVQMNHLTAAYEYHKGLAAAAALAH